MSVQSEPKVAFLTLQGDNKRNGGSATILNFSVIRGRLLEGGDYWRDDYYSRKYGECAIKTIN